MTGADNKPIAFIPQSELDFISKCVLDYPDLETGGDFFGLWTKEGFPVVHYVIGPGRKTTRTSTSFYQDIEYLRECGKLLNSKFGLQHIGAWHSHHRLSLSHPSSGDINTMRNALRDSNISRFLISICNIDHHSRVSTNGFLFLKDHSQDYTPCQWTVLKENSPYREKLLNQNSDLFIFPETKTASSNVKTEDIKDNSEKKTITEKPDLSANSYWSKPEGKAYLKNTFEKLNNRRDLTDVELLQLADKRIAISFKHDEGDYELRFPIDFPKGSPEIIEKKTKAETDFIPSFFKSDKRNKNNIRQFIYSLDIIDKNLVLIIR